MNISAPKRKGVGRPKGQPTTVKVKLIDLLSVLQPNSPVVVGTLFARDLGLELPDFNAQENQFRVEDLF